MIDELDFITLSSDPKNSYRQKKDSIAEEEELEEETKDENERITSGKDICTDEEETQSRGSLLSLNEEKIRRNVHYKNTCQVPFPDRIKKTSIDNFILYLPNLESALLLWSQVSFHQNQCPLKSKEPKMRRRRSSQMSTSSMLQFDRMRSRSLSLTEFNEELFSKHREKKQLIKKQRRSSYIATQIMTKHHVRDIERDQQSIRNVLEGAAKRRSSVAVTSETRVRTSPVPVRCVNCGHAVCCCESPIRTAFSAPSPDSERRSSLSSLSVSSYFNSVSLNSSPHFNNIYNVKATTTSPRKRRISKVCVFFVSILLSVLF